MPKINIREYLKENYKDMYGSNVSLEEVRRQEKEVFEKIHGREENIPVNQIDEFDGHTFIVSDDAEMQTLIKSIDKDGLMSRVVVRKKDNRYEMLSGHRRLYACKKLGMETIPAKIITADDEKAKSLMMFSNLASRTVLTSEKAKCYMIMLNSGNSIEEISEQVGISIAAVYMYLKVAKLTDRVKKLVDVKAISLQVAQEIDGFSEEIQNLIADEIENNGLKLKKDSLRNAKEYLKRKPNAKPEKIIEVIKTSKKQKNKSKSKVVDSSEKSNKRIQMEIHDNLEIFKENNMEILDEIELANFDEFENMLVRIISKCRNRNK